MTKFSIPYLFLVSLFLSACTKDTVVPPSDQSASSAAANSAENALPPYSLFPLQSWQPVASGRGVISSIRGGLVFSGNSQGQFYAHQQVVLPPRQFFKVSVTVDYTINDYSPAGIYVMDTAMTNTMGEFEKVYSSGSAETWEFVFYSKTAGPVSLVIGFLNGMNGKVTFTNAAITTYQYRPRISAAGLSNYLSRKLRLVFTAKQYDTSICKISDYVNSVLLCRYEYYADTIEQPILDNLIGADSAYTYFNDYRNTPDSITDSYCQKSSLSLGEILTNAFNIPVRQIYMVIGGVGLHQFQEYWNPFAGKWIIIDPCFSTRYLKDGVLLGDQDIDSQTAPGYITRFGQYYYYQTLDPLIQLWQQLEVLDVNGYYSITFPYI
jgi:hypothetical protein